MTDLYTIAIALIGLVFAAVVCLFTVLELNNHASRFGIIDEPDHRKIHTKPIARIGGLGIIAGFFAGILYFDFARRYCGGLGDIFSVKDVYLLTGAIVIAVTGLVDDMRSISFRQKLVVQCLVAVYMILAGARLELDFGIFPGYANAISIPLTFFWIIGVTNALNLIDGLDGLAGGTFIISLITISICALLIGQPLQIVLLFTICGSVLGFLLVNWHPAKVFMGDSGSLFLGYIIACYALDATARPNNFFVFLVPIFAVGLPVFDTLLSMGRRALKQRPMFYPDRDHIHHRIQRIYKLTQRQTVYALYGINIIWGVVAITLSIVGNLSAFFVTLIGFAFLLLLLYRLEYITQSSFQRYLKNRLQKRNSRGTTLTLPLGR